MRTRETMHGRDHYRWWQPIVTRGSDNDIYGHVSNAVYYHWFDTAVNSWLLGAGLLDLQGGDPIGLVVETSCRYARPVSYPTPVDIGLALDRLGTSSVTYRLGAFTCATDEPFAEAGFTHVYVGRESRRPVALPLAWRRQLEALAPRPSPEQ